jgi:hypothetical protein
MTTPTSSRRDLSSGYQTDSSSSSSPKRRFRVSSPKEVLFRKEHTTTHNTALSSASSNSSIYDSSENLLTENFKKLQISTNDRQFRKQRFFDVTTFEDDDVLIDELIETKSQGAPTTSSDDFDNLDDEKILQMSAAQRNALKIKLTLLARQEIENDNVFDLHGSSSSISSPNSSDSNLASQSPLLVAKAKKGLRHIEEVQKELRNSHLVESIVSNDFQTWERLFLSSDSIIDSALLFSLLSSALDPNKKDYSTHKALLILQFTKFWLERNRGRPSIHTIRLEIAAILKTANASTENSIHEQAKKVKQAFINALIPHQDSTIHIHTTDSFKDFKKIVKKVSRDSSEDFQESAKTVAKDLLNHQIILYLHVTPYDLLQATHSNQDSKISKIFQFHTALVEFAVDLILAQESLEERVRLVKFFVAVLAECLQHNDFMSASSLSVIFYNIALTKLTKTWERVFSDEYCSKIKEQTRLFFFNGQNKSLLLERIEACYMAKKIFIPDLLPLVNDISLVQQSPTIIDKEDSDPLYNFDKIRKIQELIKKPLALQKRMEEFAKSLPFNTNLISKYIQSHSPSDDENRLKRALSLETQ